MKKILILAISLFALSSAQYISHAEHLSSEPEARIQYGDPAPPPAPDTPEAQGPGEIETPALEDVTTLDSPDPALGEESAVSEPDPVVEEGNPLVEQEEPVVEQADPLVEQPGAMVPEGEPVVE